MSREIKFKVWGPQSKVMIDWDDIKNELVDYIDHYSYILMQFTGLVDRNGIEIYESDIVYDLNHEAKGIVVWQNNSCDYELEDRDGNFIQAFGFEKSLYEVIGNIYENPELLTA